MQEAVIILDDDGFFVLRCHRNAIHMFHYLFVCLGVFILTIDNSPAELDSLPE